MSVLSVRIDSGTVKLLASFIREGADGNRSLTKAEIVRVALRRYLKAESSYWEIVFRRLNRTSEEIQTLSYRIDVLLELFFHYLDYYFLLWPDFDPQEEEDRRRTAERMIRRFEDSLKKSLRDGGHAIDLLPEELQDLMRARVRDPETQENSSGMDAQNEKSRPVGK